MAARWLASFRGRLLFAAAALFLASGALLANYAAKTAESALSQNARTSAQRMLQAFEKGVSARIEDADRLRQQDGGQRNRRAQDMADMGAAILDYFWDQADQNPRSELPAKNQALACMDQAGLFVADADNVLLTPFSEEKKRAVFGRDPSSKLSAMWETARKEGKGLLVRPSSGDDRGPDAIAFAWHQQWDFLVAAPAPKAENAPDETPSADGIIKDLAQAMAGTQGPDNAFFWVFTGKALLPVVPRPLGETWPPPFVSVRDSAFTSLVKAAATPDTPVGHRWPSLTEGAAMDVATFVHKLPDRDVYLAASIPDSDPAVGVRYRMIALVLVFGALFCLLLWSMAGKLGRELSWLADSLRALAQGQSGRLPAPPKRPYREVAKVAGALSTLEEALPRLAGQDMAKARESRPLPFGTRFTPPPAPPLPAAPPEKPSPPKAQAPPPVPRREAAAPPPVPTVQAPAQEPPSPRPAAPPRKTAQAFPPKPESLEDISIMLAQFLTAHGADPDSARELLLAAEEVAGAVIATKADSLTEITIRISMENFQARLTLEHDGPPFDPTADSSPEDAGPLPGLGQSLLVQLVDQARWERRDQKNLTTLEKKMAP